jgi:hypothetical protein
LRTSTNAMARSASPTTSMLAGSATSQAIPAPAGGFRAAPSPAVSRVPLGLHPGGGGLGVSPGSRRGMLKNPPLVWKRHGGRPSWPIRGLHVALHDAGRLRRNGRHNAPGYDGPHARNRAAPRPARCRD